MMGCFQGDFLKRIYQKAYNLDEKQADQFVKACMDFPKGLRSFSMMVEPGQPGEPILGGILGIYGVEDAKTFLANCEKYFQTINDSVGKTGKGEESKPFYTFKKSEVGGRPALEIETAIPLSSNVKQVPGAEKMMEKLYGADGKIRFLYVAVDDHTLAMSFGGHAPLILRVIEAIKQPAEALASDPGIVEMSKLLPADAQWTGYVSPAGCVAFVKWIVETTVSEGQFKPNIPDFPASPPIGVAVKAVSGEVQTEAIVPAAVLDAVGKYVGIVQNEGQPAP
jgi:hypothetical protein